MTKRRNRIYRRIAVALTVALLAGQSHAFVRAEGVAGDTQTQTEVSSEERNKDAAGSGNTGDTDNGLDRGDNSGDADNKDIGDKDIVDDGNLEDDGEENTDDSAAGQDMCVCQVKCIEDAVNTDCPVCAADYVACTGKADDGENNNIENNDPEGNKAENVEVEADDNTEDDGNVDTQEGINDQDMCICETSCHVYNVNGDCPVCMADYEACVEDTRTKVTHDGIKYVVTESGKVEVGEQGKDAVSGKISIPETFEQDGVTYQVTGIGDGAFYRCYSLIGVEIPKSVTRIGELAFYYCSSLISVKIPEGVTSIGYETFCYCTSLTSVTIPEGVTSIGYGAFHNCESLPSVTIPESVTSIEGLAFLRCYSLTSVTIPKSMTSIGVSVFYECSSLTSVTISENIILIEGGAFTTCKNLVELRIVVLSDGEYHFPELGPYESFGGTPVERYILFVDEAGKQLTGDAFNEAFAKAAASDGSDDGKWYGWSYKGTAEAEDTYTVTINVKKDRDPWSGHGRSFALLKSGGGFINVPGQAQDTTYQITQVPDGIYRIFDVTGVTADSLYSQARDTGMDVRVSGMDTTVTVTVDGKDENANVNYYTATFYDGTEAYGADTPQKPQFVISGQGALRPDDPSKSDYQFAGWKTEDGGSTTYDFGSAVTDTTSIFASWVAKTSGGDDGDNTIPGGGDGENPNPGGNGGGDNTNPGGGGGGNSNSGGGGNGGDPYVTVVSDAASAPIGVDKTGNTDTTPVSDAQTANGTEPKTGDASHMEVYATIAMIAGLTYLLLYFMEEGRGMTEREKDAFVAAFIRWGKKGGAFRKGCAMLAIFCLLAYYHAIGKRAGKNALHDKYLEMVS